jgi:3-oxoadipate enol-lactonase
MPLVQLNGIDRYYEQTGSGEPLLLINGLGGTALSWEPLLPALAARFRVITSDNRGVGRSAAPPGPYTTRQMADDAAVLPRHLGVERAHVVGSSMGGMIAQELVLGYPTLVNRLVLYATFARPRRTIIDPWLTFVTQMEERLDPTAVALAWLPWLYTPAFLARPEQVEAALAWQEPYPAPAHGIAAQAEAAREHDTLDRLPLIASLTLVLVGAEDVVTPVYYARELAERIPGARLQVLERGGHSAIWEYPQTGAEALIAFLVT